MTFQPRIAGLKFKHTKQSLRSMPGEFWSKIYAWEMTTGKKYFRFGMIPLTSAEKSMLRDILRKYGYSMKHYNGDKKYHFPDILLYEIKQFREALRPFAYEVYLWCHSGNGGHQYNMFPSERFTDEKIIKLH